MKTLNASRPSGGSPASRFGAFAFSIAESGNEFIESELIARVDRSTAMSSPEAEGCFGPSGWHDYGVSHDGRLEIDVGDEMSFIFTECSLFGSCGHFGHKPSVNLRDAQGNEMAQRPGGVSCVPLDEWTGKLT